MDNSPLFYKYYDTLFAAKDYAGEVAAVLNHYSGQQLQLPAHILEVGCGTGNHTVELARIDAVHVTAVDVDLEMLALARKKAELANKTNITFASGISSAENVDLCVALFNVVNYVCDDESLCTFFADIAASLRLKCMFIFDCWNGAAALLDPPGSKNYEQHCDGGKVICKLTSQTDSSKKITTLNYYLELTDNAGNKIESGNYQFAHKLWTPEQIKSALLDAGFVIEKLCIPFKFETVATDADWKIMFVCRK
jgi:SAM-dependent methyltransferase